MKQLLLPNRKKHQSVMFPLWSSQMTGIVVKITNTIMMMKLNPQMSNGLNQVFPLTLKIIQLKKKIKAQDAENEAVKDQDPKYVGVRPLSELEKQLIKSKEESDAKLAQLQEEMEEVKRLTLQ